MPSSRSLDAPSGGAIRESLCVVIGKVTAIDWISQLERELRGQLSGRGSVVRIMRLVDALRFELNGRLFAVLRVDRDGLFFRHWFPDGGYHEWCQVTLDRARTLVRNSVSEAQREFGPR